MGENVVGLLPGAVNSPNKPLWLVGTLIIWEKEILVLVVGPASCTLVPTTMPPDRRAFS